MIREVQTPDKSHNSAEEGSLSSGRSGLEAKPISDEFDGSESIHTKPVTGVKRIVYILLAGLFFVLGVIGAILPVIPTTPFLLLTSFFLIRISPRLNEALLNAPLVGPVLRDWQELRGVRPTVKVQAIVIVICIVGVSLSLSNMHIIGKSLLALLAMIGITVIIRIPTLSDKSEKDRS
ncbi:MAG: YbaN family protein [Planctomycetaceae bacterium]|nr:YbaN family protein [Planctomycetaceae bacterium]